MTYFEELLLAELPRSAMQFFLVFSRFECALKRSGTFAMGGMDGVVPDWDKFAQSLGPDFFDGVKRDEFAKELIERPPQETGASR